MQDREALISKRAHQIWQDEGCPDGQSDTHWEAARAEIDGLADEGAVDAAKDDAPPDEPEHEEPALLTTREGAAFALANSPAPEKRR